MRVAIYGFHNPIVFALYPGSELAKLSIYPEVLSRGGWRCRSLSQMALF